jgi:hypothetical protein
MAWQRPQYSFAIVCPRAMSLVLAKTSDTDGKPPDGQQGCKREGNESAHRNKLISRRQPRLQVTPPEASQSTQAK